MVMMMMLRRRVLTVAVLGVLGILSLTSRNNNGVVLLASAVYCPERCSTGKCDADSRCICIVPPASSYLDGDRKFQGGEFCDEPRTMCDGSTDFWCGHESTCVEIVQGENYTCICPDGFKGNQCELVGLPCGNQLYCFNGAQCEESTNRCLCPSDWMGNQDCSIATNQSATTGPDSNMGRNYTGATNGNSWGGDGDGGKSGGTVIVVLFVGVIVVVVIIGAKKMYERKDKRHEFGKIQQLQMIEDVEGDTLFPHHQPRAKRTDDL